MARTTRFDSDFHVEGSADVSGDMEVAGALFVAGVEVGGGGAELLTGNYGVFAVTTTEVAIDTTVTAGLALALSAGTDITLNANETDITIGSTGLYSVRFFQQFLPVGAEEGSRSANLTYVAGSSTEATVSFGTMASAVVLGALTGTDDVVTLTATAVGILEEGDELRLSLSNADQTTAAALGSGQVRVTRIL